MRMRIKRLLASAVGAVLLGGGGAVVAAAPAQAAGLPDGYYKPAYTDTITEVWQGLSFPITGEDWARAGYPTPRPAPTEYVKYPWAPAIYAVTYWPDGWDWDQLAGPQWAKAGYPAPRSAGYIEGTDYTKWDTSGEIFATSPDGVVHKLTYGEWAASGYQQPTYRTGEGFLVRSWNGTVAQCGGLGGNSPYCSAQTFDQWAAQGFPTPQVVQRMPNDEFIQYAPSTAIYAFGPGLSSAQPITYAQWVAAGSPTPHR